MNTHTLEDRIKSICYKGKADRNYTGVLSDFKP